jgi:hypothetical protein
VSHRGVGRPRVRNEVIRGELGQLRMKVRVINTPTMWIVRSAAVWYPLEARPYRPLVARWEERGADGLTVPHDRVGAEVQKIGMLLRRRLHKSQNRLRHQ